MALYDYRCQNCGTVFTLRATFKEKDAGLDPVCPVCHVQDARHIISAPLLAGVNALSKSYSLPLQAGSCCASGGGCACA
jgi:putative FmdB family regulatory protein